MISGSCFHPCRVLLVAGPARPSPTEPPNGGSLRLHLGGPRSLPKTRDLPQTGDAKLILARVLLARGDVGDPSHRLNAVPRRAGRLQVLAAGSRGPSPTRARLGVAPDLTTPSIREHDPARR